MSIQDVEIPNGSHSKKHGKIIVISITALVIGIGCIVLAVRMGINKTQLNQVQAAVKNFYQALADGDTHALPLLVVEGFEYPGAALPSKEHRIFVYQQHKVETNFHDHAAQQMLVINLVEEQGSSIQEVYLTGTTPLKVVHINPVLQGKPIP